MAVKHKVTAIVIWVLCAVLLVVVGSLAVFLFCLQRRRRRHRQYLTTAESGAHKLIRSDEVDVEAESFYRGFRRSTVEDLETVPSTSDAESFRAPLMVQLCVRPGYAIADTCDVLLTVDRLRDPQPSDRCRRQVLGCDGFYHGNFLLYTAPLEFRDDGLYLVHAHTVYPSACVVGAVHRFIFVVQNATTARGPSPASAPLALPSIPTGGIRGTPNSVDIDIARRQAERAGAHGNAFDSGELAPPSAFSPRSTLTPAAAVEPALGATPLPPTIVPGSGEVTTSTEIVIAPHEHSVSPDQLRYSVDGSYPTMLYTGPFTLTLPPPSLLPSQRRQVVVQAIAVSSTTGSAVSPSHFSHGGVSSIARAVLLLRPAGLSFFDPQVPAPSMRLRATDATLYFDESHNPPHTETLYELVYVNEMRRKVKFSRERAQRYDGHPVQLSENVATVHAWTVMREGGMGYGDSYRGGFNTDNADLVRSVPTIYDCSRAEAERGKLSRRRVEQYNLRPEQLLPPPVMCVSCSEMELAFDDPPANGRIAYTLNDTEPALCDVTPPACAVPIRTSTGMREVRRLEGREAHMSPIAGDSDGAHTYLYQPGKHIHVTLLESQRVYVTARIFMPVFEGSDGALYGYAGGQGGSCQGSGKLLGYRYGGVFHRGFYFQNGAGGQLVPTYTSSPS